MSAIVFDLDGTLVDSFDDISAAFRRSFPCRRQRAS